MAPSIRQRRGASKGATKSLYEATVAKSPSIPAPLPEARPPFSIKDVRSAIPAHCFKRSYFKSFFHLFTDLALASCLFIASTYISHDAVPVALRYVLWPLYWILQGIVCTGLWVLAHECGHGGFSDSTNVNDLVGFVIHSLLLVPYHSWQITHRRHHQNTGSVENDEVFVPRSRSELGLLKPAGDKKDKDDEESFVKEMLEETPLFLGLTCFAMLTIGWMPGYLFLGSSGPCKYAGQPKSHFNPNAAFFTPKNRWDIIKSDIGFFGAVALLAVLGAQYGWTQLLCFYVIPYMLVNAHLVGITFLQHTDVYMPHFRAPEWTWLRGALCTVDRSFGSWGAANTHNTAPPTRPPVATGSGDDAAAVLAEEGVLYEVGRFFKELFSYDARLHHITDTHVAHHLFSTMPFYNAREATAALRAVLGPYYLYDPTPVGSALWRAWSTCRVIEDEDDIAWYKTT